MNLKQIELLRAVITCQTTVKAARMLGMSQPAVSNAIRHLEDQLGFPLFERVNNRLFTTEQARLIFAESEALFQNYQVFAERLESIKHQKHEVFRVYSSPPLGHSLIPMAMERFFHRRTGIRAIYEIANYDQVVQNVEIGQADLGFAIGQIDDRDFHVEPLFAEPMVCVMPPDSPLAALSVIRPEDLMDQPLVSLERSTGMGQAVRRVFQQAGRGMPRQITETRYCNTACILVQHGVGVAVVDALSALSAVGDRLVLRRFEPSEVQVASAIYSKKRLLSRTAEEFLKEVRRSAKVLSARLGELHTSQPPISAPSASATPD